MQFWKVLGSPGWLLGPWKGLEPSWAHRGGVLGGVRKLFGLLGLGPLLGALGPSWGGLGGHLATNKSQDRNQDRPRSNSGNIFG